MHPYTTNIQAALRTVIDPDLKKDIITLNMVKDLQVNDENISFTLVLTTPACPYQAMFKKKCTEAIQKILPQPIPINIHIHAEVTSRESSSLLPKVKNILAIASGKGGVGKSTIATNLAIALSQQGTQVGLIDADIFGPSIPTMFYCENEKPHVIKKKGKNYLVPLENYGVKLLSMGLLADPNDAVVWRGPMASAAFKQLLKDTDWGSLDYLLVDLPPGTSDIHLTLVQSVPLTGAIIITTPQKVACIDAQKAIAMFTKMPQPVAILGIIENMSFFIPKELPDHQYHIFGKGGGNSLAKKNNVPFLGQIPLVQNICNSGDSGYPIMVKTEDPSQVYFKKMAVALAQQVAIGNNTMA